MNLENALLKAVYVLSGVIVVLAGAIVTMWKIHRAREDEIHADHRKEREELECAHKRTRDEFISVLLKIIGEQG
tara:strand:+ start:180 stop:401 length:222 start_codon:yes stop_codon:yes gene_type:complete